MTPLPFRVPPRPRGLAGLSWQVKIPLALTAVILLTELVVTTALMVRTLRDARADLQVSAVSLGNVLGRSLRGPMLRDDLWQAFEVVRTPIAARADDNPLQSVVVLDLSERVFVASDPRSFPVATPASDLPSPLLDAARRSQSATGVIFVDEGRLFRPGELVAAGPIVADDGTRLGTVLLDFDANLHAQRLRSALVELGLVSLPGLLLLVPLGWIAGKRLAGPLVQTAQALSRVGRDPPASIAAALPKDGYDEVGRLAAQARSMLGELARKEELEREMVASERLAAVGRVSAAIAHEINNPLGGMLNAIDTATTHGTHDPVTRKTLGLLERGLLQIRATVGALLVEARYDAAELRGQDWEDLRLLISPQLDARGLALEWEVDLAASALPLPAHAVRQLVLNLLLNAVKAAQPVENSSPTVAMVATAIEGELLIVVGNTGPEIPLDQRARLFEPFLPGPQQDGHRAYGLGLWVCWQIVQRLDGTIGVGCEDGWTRFTAVLPLALAPDEGD